VGFLHIERVLPLVMDKVDPAGLTLDDVVSPPMVVPPTKKVNEMLDFFQSHKARAALVLNEFGGVEGIVSMRDVLTFVFGHLSGEVRGEAFYAERDQDLYEVPGDMRLVDFNNLTNFGIEDPRMTTIGGVVFRHLDRLPEIGDQVTVEDVQMTVLEMDEQRIARLRVSRGGTGGEPGPAGLAEQAGPAEDEAERVEPPRERGTNGEAEGT
jgi:CBS domain containing-hemolysin-like protein